MSLPIWKSDAKYNMAINGQEYIYIEQQVYMYIYIYKLKKIYKDKYTISPQIKTHTQNLS